MSKSFSYVVLTLIGTIALILFLQNLSLSASVKFLGLVILPLPIGLLMLLAFGVGALVAIPLNWVLRQVRFMPSPPAMAVDNPVIDVEYEDE